MPISRPILIALVAAVVAVFGFYATQGSRNAADPAPEVASAPTPAPAKPRTVKRADTATRDTVKGKRDVVAQAARSKRGTPAGIPAQVQRAIGAHKLVVLFFYKLGSADDERTARGVATLRGRNVAVFTSSVGRLAKYRGLVGDLGISQAPAVVIVKPNRTARVIEGYIDPATLAQDVADAR
jgi:hypothetical protein